MVYGQALDGEEVRNHITRNDNEGEEKVATLLSNVGFDLVDSNVVLQDYPEPIRGEVDLVYESGDVLLLVEVSTGKYRISHKKRNFFGKWAGGPLVEELKEKLGRQSHTVRRIYFDLRPRPENIGEPEAVGIDGPGSMNMICFQEDFDRLADGVKLGEMTKDGFLADFR